ncbi:hypothetical protein [Celeribacter marinus]|uniref:hypothetical protein n=1 Tax=Celeribacter marinus TaxID=1397108 RepID=UPI0031761449
MSDPIPMPKINAALCPSCGTSFVSSRPNKKYCTTSCSKKATRNSGRDKLRAIHTDKDPRRAENKRRSHVHYNCAAWLTYDVTRLADSDQRKMILALLEAASNKKEGARTRNILTDTKLLWADPLSYVGKLHPDTHYPEVINIAQMVNAFCWKEWGCSSRDMILDKGKPSERKFIEPIEPKNDPNIPPHIYNETLDNTKEVHLKRNHKEFFTAISRTRCTTRT